MASKLLAKVLTCASCKRRAEKVGLLKKEAFCPISGQAGDCPFAKNSKGSKDGVKKPKAPEKELTKVEKLLQRGSELVNQEQFSYAELSYDKAIELDPKDWRGHFGKVTALQGQGKYFVAFSAARKGLEAVPGNRNLVDLQETVRLQYKDSKKAPADETSVKKTAAGVSADAKAMPPTPSASLAAPACPGSAAGEALQNAEFKWEAQGRRNPTKEERAGAKEMMLNIFREQWERIGKAKETMGYADYSSEQKDGLKITGGHRPMPKPKGILLPKDFREEVGLISVEELGKYDCNSDRLLISLYGDIFDVSDRPDKYGKEGPYYYFAGRDITWGLMCGDDSEDTVNKFYDMFKLSEALINKKMQCICSWLGFYETEYGQAIGRLKEFEAEHELPPPPLTNEEQCVVQ